MIFPQRKSPRIPGYDYAKANYYFITICTYEKKCIFGKPWLLNGFGEIAKDCFEAISVIYPGIRVDKYVVMPNHIHGIICIDGLQGSDLTKIVGQYKMSVTKKIREKEPGMEVWQRSFHDHVIRNQKSYEMIWQYIDQNPLKWEEDCFFSKME